MMTVSAAEFEAKCLDLLEQVAARKLGQVEVTRDGKVLAVLRPPATPEAAVHPDAFEVLHGCLRGSVIIPDGLDLTAPAYDYWRGAD